MRPIASNGYIGIYKIDYDLDDSVYWAYGESSNPKLHKSRIYYTKTSGRPYFKQNGTRRYLDDFQRLGGF